MAQERGRVELSPGSGVTAARTAGSARAAKVLATMAHTESRVRWSAEMMASSARSQPGAAAGWEPGCRRPPSPRPAAVAPAVQVGGGPVVEGGGVQQAADHRQRLGAPEVPVLHSPSAGVGDQASARIIAVCGPFAAPGERPAQHRRHPGRPGSLGGRRPSTGPTSARAARVRPGCRPGGGGDHRPRRVEDHGDDQVEALAGAGRAEQEDRVLHARPALHPPRGAQPVADIARAGPGQGPPQRRRPSEQHFGPGRTPHLPGGRHPIAPGHPSRAGDRRTPQPTGGKTDPQPPPGPGP